MDSAFHSLVVLSQLAEAIVMLSEEKVYFIPLTRSLPPGEASGNPPYWSLTDNYAVFCWVFQYLIAVLKFS
jgi:hypothetical protein